MEINLIPTTLGLIISLIGVFLGVLVSLKCTGRLKISVIFLSLTTAILFIYHTSAFVSLTGNAIGIDIGKNLDYIVKANGFHEGLDLIIALLIILSSKLLNNLKSVPCESVLNQSTFLMFNSWRTAGKVIAFKVCFFLTLNKS